jgi:hypothetical protein
MTRSTLLLAAMIAIGGIGFAPASAAEGWKYGEPLTISAGKDSYQLPPIHAAGWRTPFERCGLGDSW